MWPSSWFGLAMAGLWDGVTVLSITLSKFSVAIKIYKYVVWSSPHFSRYWNETDAPKIGHEQLTIFHKFHQTWQFIVTVYWWNLWKIVSCLWICKYLGLWV
jgi:hypothetical protein